MKRNKQLRSAYIDHIDLNKFIKYIWNKRALVIPIFFVYLIILFAYYSLKPKINVLEITTRTIPGYIFENHINSEHFSFLNKDKQENSFENNFMKEFELTLLSRDELLKFQKLYDQIDNSKNYPKNNLDIIKNLDNNINLSLIASKEKNRFKYVLTSHQKILGNFLDDYVIHVYKKTLEKFKKNLVQMLANDVDEYKKNLIIAKKLNIVKPYQPIIEGTLFAIPNTNQLFFQGAEVLKEEIIFLEKKIEIIKDIKFDFNPILEKAVVSNVGSKIFPSKLSEILILIIFGFFGSFVIIFIKFILQQK